ncbi:hypothetical protein DL765_008303 [Monosporascus sp. GIB2]|nr:hypothetical protein DL765_008303 [Monosporascus sp. GIB2]
MHPKRNRMTTTPPLPAPRTLLTSLINTLASAPLAPPDPALTNPLGRLPASHRALLATLHALYPSVLLPALDVLDRRLVTRVFVDGGSGGAGASTAAASAVVERGGGVGAGVDASAGPGASGNVTVSGAGASEEAAGTMLERRQVAPEADPVPPSRSLAAMDAEAAEAGTGAGRDGGGDDGRSENKRSPPNRRRLGSGPTFHIVRSAQPSQPFRRQHGGHHQFRPNTRQQTYVVRLRAWSCTCAAFAFASYPFEAPPSRNANPSPARQRGRAAGVDNYYAIEPASSPSVSGPGSAARDPGDSGRDEDGLEWEFGGLSIDGRDDDEGGDAAAGMWTGAAAGVPACKHLLACVLGERLAGLGLGEYMDERRVGREEGAGLVGEA